jgi:hypothetical protein
MIFSLLNVLNTNSRDNSDELDFAAVKQNIMEKLRNGWSRKDSTKQLRNPACEGEAGV